MLEDGCLVVFTAVYQLKQLPWQSVTMHHSTVYVPYETVFLLADVQFEVLFFGLDTGHSCFATHLLPCR